MGTGLESSKTCWCHEGPLVAPPHPTKEVWAKKMKERRKERQCITHDRILDQKHSYNGCYWENLELVRMLDNKFSECANYIEVI